MINFSKCRILKDMDNIVPANLLCLDCSGVQIAVAVVKAGIVERHQCEAGKHGQGEILFPLIESIMRDLQMEFKQLSAIVVGEGPGSFTGIRTALATARGLSMALSIPTIGINSFTVYLHHCRSRHGLLGEKLAAAGFARILVLIDSRRDSPFIMEFLPNGPNGESTAAPQLIDRAAVVALFSQLHNQKILVTGDAVGEFHKLYPLNQNQAKGSIIEMEAAIDIVSLAQLGLQAWSDRSYHKAVPCYIREPDISQPKTALLKTAANLP